MVSITIDNRSLEVDAGTMIIEAADNAGIRIPRFCYHKKLSIAANCRMCLVDVGNAPKALPACATPVSEGMVIKTQSAKAIEAQKSVMEFLLINHPLDCPICDQGGECELQDLAVGYGSDVSRFAEGKRVVIDKNLGSLIATDMTRCIHCTRCVRFGQEIAGIRELGATGRGEHMQIGTFIETAVTSELSGNVIDVCPVGALTSKPFRFKARAWELKQYPGIAAHDCLGSNVYWHVHNNKVQRVVPREKETINEMWLSDRDRFSYQGLQSIDRLIEPRMKENGAWHTASWETAFSSIRDVLGAVLKAGSGDDLAMLLSPNLTTEEYYLAQKIMRALGSNNIDHRLQQVDFRSDLEAPLYPNLGIDLQLLGEQDLVILVGSDIQREQPLLSARLVQGAKQNTQVMSINPIDFFFAFDVSHKCIAPAGNVVHALAGILKEVMSAEAIASDSQLAEFLEKVIPQEAEIACATRLKAGGKFSFVLGALALSHPEASTIHYLAQALATVTQGTFGVLTPGCNSAGAWIAGAVPHRGVSGASLPTRGHTAFEMVHRNQKVFILVNVEPELDTIFAQELLKKLEQADYVIALTPYLNPTLLQYCDVLLPMVPVSETSGTFVNTNGVWQTFHAVSQPMGEARPLWKILRALGSLLYLDGFHYETLEEVLQDLKMHYNEKKLVSHQITSSFLKGKSSQMGRYGALVLISPYSLYKTDNIVRRATALQEMQAPTTVCLNATMAQKFDILEATEVCIRSEGELKITLPLEINNRVPDDAVWISRGGQETRQLDRPYHLVQVERA